MKISSCADLGMYFVGEFAGAAAAALAFNFINGKA